MKDGTIIEFLHGSHTYEGVAFGDLHPTRVGRFWWRSILREYLSAPTPSVSAEDAADEYVKKYAINGVDAKIVRRDFLAGVDFASRKPAGMRWVKASERLPILPDPLPKDTIDERGVLFVNRAHSAGAFWYPSYGVSAISFLNNYNGWNINDWEWLDEHDEPEYLLDNGSGTTTVYGGKPAGEGYSRQQVIGFNQWLAENGYEFCEHRYKMYLGGKYHWVNELFDKYEKTIQPAPSNWIEIKEGEEKPG